MTIGLSAEQERAVGTAAEWFRNHDLERSVFRLFGYAGTGKTTVLNELTTRMGLAADEIMYVAPTGRAARVMADKGASATTVHRAFYTVAKSNEDQISALHEEAEDILSRQRARTDRHNMPGMMRRLAEITMELQSGSATPRVEFAFRGIKAVPAGTRLIVVDEASMLGNDTLVDLESLHLPIVLVGDPGQLPPVGQDDSAVTGVDPDVMLTAVQRQDGESSILDIARLAREGQEIAFGRDDNGVAVEDGRGFRSTGDLCSRLDINLEYFDQILCGTNRRRHDINDLMRAEAGLGGLLPSGATGEKLICRRNYRTDEHFISNGSMISVRNDAARTPGICAPGSEATIDHPVIITAVDGVPAHIADVALWRAPLEDPRERDKTRRGREGGLARRCLSAEWGWGITVHAAQGSQWQKVCVFDESRAFRANANRWLYTAVTRACSELLIIRV